MNARLSFDAELESLSASLIRMGALAVFLLIFAARTP